MHYCAKFNNHVTVTIYVVTRVIKVLQLSAGWVDRKKTY